MLTLQDYRQYIQNRGKRAYSSHTFHPRPHSDVFIAKYIENDCSLLRSKIRALHPVHKASLEALLRHLLRVASHSDKNGMTVGSLAAEFHGRVLRGSPFLQDGVNVKARCDYFLYFLRLIPSKSLVMEDLIRNAHTLFDEEPSLSPSIPSPHVTETASTCTYDSLSFSPELPQSGEIQATGSTARHNPDLVVGIPASIQSYFSSSPSDATVENRLTPPPITLLSPLLGLLSSKTLTEGVETTMQERVIPNARGASAVETLPDSTPPDVVSLPVPTSVAEWRLHQSRLSPLPEALSMPPNPPESVLSSMSDFPLSSATSLQTGRRGFSQ